MPPATILAIERALLRVFVVRLPQYVNESTIIAATFRNLRDDTLPRTPQNPRVERRE
jgi:hypothetical protein